MIESIEKNVVWRAILPAGLMAGLAMLATNILLTPLVLDVDASVIINYIASLALGEDMLTDTTGTGIIAIALVVHFMFSLIFTLVIAIVVHRWGFMVGMIGGAILGLSIYAINLYTMTLIFEWFFAINSWVLAISHVVFGAVAGGIYEMLDHYDQDLLNDPLLAAHELNEEQSI